MSTDVRPELSEHSKYHISRHRYYELRHFCMQYPEWMEKVSGMDMIWNSRLNTLHAHSAISDPTSKTAIERERYLNNMHLIEKACMDTDKELSNYIFKAVTKGTSFVELSTLYEMPCGKDMYYDRFRKFFWVLDKLKD